jgi:hypothetical protein
MASKSSNSNKNWKDQLLRSGVPLEYEVASILADNGFAVDADYSFLRRDADNLKEFSVDIDATWYGGTSSVYFKLEIPIECKYRSRDKYFLFLPDPNLEDYSSVTIGGTVLGVDHFVPYNLPSDSFIALESSIDYAYKGLEIHGNSATDHELTRGIQQLRYAMPGLVRQGIDFNFSPHPSDTLCLFFTRILVTNAPLRMLLPRINIETIESANSIEDISMNVDTVILFSDYGPDYEDHFRSTFSENQEYRLEWAHNIKERLKKQRKNLSYQGDPVGFIEDLTNASRFVCSKLSTQFFITTIYGLPPLLSALKSGCTTAYRHRTGASVKRRHKILP